MYMKNSEILFLYSAKLCNPNGDPDDENRPRLDHKTMRNLVSDVRLKRYIRDFIIDNYGEKYVWVSTVGGENVASDERGWSLIEQWSGDERVKGLKKENVKEWVKLIPELCVDARLFGATVAIRARGKAKGASHNFIGPVQFSWGYSLHPVEIVESSTITSIFVGREETGETGRYGTIGKDWRLYFSLIAFYGIVSGSRAEGTGLDEEDIKLLDNILWDALGLRASTRSKIGQIPHLYLRAEYKNSRVLMGDLRRFIDAEVNEPVRDVADVKLDYTRLLDRLRENSMLERIYVRESGEINWKSSRTLTQALEEYIGKERLVKLPHKELDEKHILRRN